MSPRFKFHVVMAGLVAVVALVPTPSQADHSWGSYHWARASNPVNLDVSVLGTTSMRVGMDG